MFPYEDSEILFPYPKKRNHSSFINISLAVVIDNKWKGFYNYFTMKTQFFSFLKGLKLNYGLYYDLC